MSERLWIYGVALVLGSALPLAVADLDDGTHQQGVAAGVFSAFGAFAFLLSKVLKRRYPRLANWCETTTMGACTALFSFALLVSGGSVVYAVLPLPKPLHIFGAFIIGLLGLAALMRATKDSTR